MPTPYRFQSAEEIAASLSRARAEIAAWFAPIDSLAGIPRASVGGNTFRAFRNMPQKPSIVFRNWASVEIHSEQRIAEIQRVSGQPDYDEWLNRLRGRLCAAWQESMSISMPYGASRKLTNLLLKFLVRWRGLEDQARSILTNVLHVPLDEYTLVGIRTCVNDLRIPMTATMGWVSDEATYQRIQNAIRVVTAKANCPAIYFDVLAWNMSH
jgi:hypothetical protein